jgi:hypothetical protein
MLRPNMGAKAKDKGAGEGRIVTNRRARHAYEILDTFEAGIQLRVPEVKSLRAGQVNVTDGFAYVRGGEVFLRGVHISPYAQAAARTSIPTASASCCSTATRSRSWRARRPSAASRWCPSRCTGRRAAPRSSSRSCAAARRWTGARS